VLQDEGSDSIISV